MREDRQRMQIVHRRPKKVTRLPFPFPTRAQRYHFFFAGRPRNPFFSGESLRRSDMYVDDVARRELAAVEDAADN